MSALGAAAISAAGGLIGNWITNRSAKQQYKYNLKLQQQAQQYNTSERLATQAYNEQMWDKQNAYNTPSAQRSRLEAAGYNPYMNTDGSEAGSVTSSPQSSGANSVGLSNFGANVAQSFDQLANFIFNRQLNRATVNEKNAKASESLAQSGFLNTSKHRLETLTPIEAMQLRNYAENLEEDSKLKREMQNLTKQQTISSKLGNRYQRIINKYADDQQQAALNHTYAVIANAVAELALKPYQRQELVSRAVKQFAEANNINVQSAIGRQELRILTETADSTIAAVNMENQLSEVSNRNLFGAESTFGRSIAWNWYQAQNYNNQKLKHLSLGSRNYYQQFGPKTANFMNSISDVFGKAAESAVPLGMWLLGKHFSFPTR